MCFFAYFANFARYYERKISKKKAKKTVDKLSFALYTNNIIKREKTMFDKDGNYYPNDDELNEFEESEETE